MTLLMLFYSLITGCGTAVYTLCLALLAGVTIGPVDAHFIELKYRYGGTKVETHRANP